MRARGMTHEEIARELQVSRTSITSDIAYLREQAKGTIKEYATDYLPEQYNVYLSSLDYEYDQAYIFRIDHTLSVEKYTKDKVLDGRNDFTNFSYIVI
jgi:hypothetical protein